MTGFIQGLHVTGRADPDRVVANLVDPRVTATIPRTTRNAWSAIAMANWLRQRSLAALNAYQEQSCN